MGLNIVIVYYGIWFKWTFVQRPAIGHSIILSFLDNRNSQHEGESTHSLHELQRIWNQDATVVLVVPWRALARAVDWLPVQENIMYKSADIIVTSSVSNLNTCSVYCKTSCIAKLIEVWVLHDRDNGLVIACTVINFNETVRLYEILFIFINLSPNYFDMIHRLPRIANLTNKMH